MTHLDLPSMTADGYRVDPGKQEEDRNIPLTVAYSKFDNSARSDLDAELRRIRESLNLRSPYVALSQHPLPGAIQPRPPTPAKAKRVNRNLVRRSRPTELCRDGLIHLPVLAADRANNVSDANVLWPCDGTTKVPRLQDA